jgi:hypothetical protein
MNKTVYLPDDEVETWEKARRMAGDRLSPVILKALKEYIVTKEAEAAEAAGFERIELEFEDSDDSHLLKRKAFRGKWIIPPEAPFPPDLPLKLASSRRVYAIAVTAKAQVVVYTWMHDDDFEANYNYKFLVFPSLQEAAENSDLNSAVREAVRKRGVPVEELDI